MRKRKLNPAVYPSDTEKRCSRCHEVKLRSEFAYKRSHHADGLNGKCKACVRKARIGMSEEHRIRERAYAQAYIQRHKDTVVARWKKQNESRSGPKATLSQKDLARRTLKEAVRFGKLAKPLNCQSCGIKTILHGHHDDYSKPLDVQWLCAVCHGKLHREQRWRTAGITI